MSSASPLKPTPAVKSMKTVPTTNTVPMKTPPATNTAPAEWHASIKTDQRNKIVNKITELRKRLMGPDAKANVKWSTELTASAVENVDGCVKAKKLQHSHNKGIGQNTFTLMMSPPQPPSLQLDEQVWNAAIQSWFDEHKNYVTHAFSGNKGTVGHFTQLVWRDSTEVGMAIAYSSAGGRLTAYACLNFSPQGNIINPEVWKANVPSPEHVRKCIK